MQGMRQRLIPARAVQTQRSRCIVAAAAGHQAQLVAALQQCGQQLVQRAVATDHHDAA